MEINSDCLLLTLIHRSALFNLFRDHKETMSREMASDLTTYFKGLKRTVTSYLASGNDG